LISRLKARVMARAPLSAVPYGMAAGAILGLALGGAYLAGGLAQDAALGSQANRLAKAAALGFTDEALSQYAAGGDARAVALANRYQNSPATTVVDVPAEAPQGPTARVSVGSAIASLRGPIRAAEPFRAGPLNQARELECLTEAVYYEARGETPAGQAAVAQVVLNRVRHPAFPKSVCAVVFQGAQGRRGCQFSFACDGSTRRAREAGAWERARRIATKAFSGQVVAAVGDATHFHVASVQPGWSGVIKVAQVGTHIFYRFTSRAAHGKPVMEAQADIVEALAEPVLAPEAQPQVILASATVPTVAKPEAAATVAIAPAKPEAAPVKAEAAAPKPEAAIPAKAPTL
jgi:spore germination cell wall hydrolase CwlJ-like protein